MTKSEALKRLLNAPGNRIKYRGSKFGDNLRSALCQQNFIEMDGDDMVLTTTGKLTAELISQPQPERG